ncbi:DsbA family protein [Pseudahrensia aquimaris]|uniref:DsbA family protein n=1 Tax=Pseudahrensia aquimaris TaxID=744461 RepID=A0ABW3FCN0_9HYPH
MTVKSTIKRREMMKLSAATALGVVFASGLPLSAAWAEKIDGLFDNIPLADRIMGDPNAPVTIVEYASMTCPHCKTFHEKVLPTLKEKYIETGKAKLILRPFPFDKDARGEAAFMLALCAPQDQYYGMIDAIYGIQEQLRTSPNVIQDLRRITKLAGMSEEQFNDCLSGKSQETYTQMIEGRNRASRDFKVTGTPSIYVNGEKLGDYSLDAVTAAIEAAL